MVGYTGGQTADPTYTSIGDHAEAIQIVFDPTVVSYEQLLEIFWREHDPTSRPWSRQYANGLFYHTKAQLEAAMASRDQLPGKVTTPIIPAGRFYPAEDYHQKYYLRQRPEVAREFLKVYSDEQFRDSTATARVNGYLGGYGSPEDVEATLGQLGLSVQAAHALRRYHAR